MPMVSATWVDFTAYDGVATNPLSCAPYRIPLRAKPWMK